MNTTSNNPELSYYGFSLLSFLKESHPEKVNDAAFIKSRADLAAETHSNAIREGSNQIEAEEQANEILFQGLHFSKHDTIVNVLWNEFSEIVPQSKATDFAIRILPDCESLFSKYPLSDDFAGSQVYGTLYTELTGTISIWMEGNVL